MPGKFSPIGKYNPRANRLLGKMKSDSMLAKVPRQAGVDEYNVTFGIGGRTSIGAGTTVVFTSNAPRDIILRDLVVNCDGGNAELAQLTASALTIEGNVVALGAGTGGLVFAHDNPARPEFDLPVAGGTPVSVSLTNNSAAAIFGTPTFIID